MASLSLTYFVEVTRILLIHNVNAPLASTLRIEFPAKHLLLDEHVAWLGNATRRFQHILCTFTVTKILGREKSRE